jgi:hypothetical protein
MLLKIIGWVMPYKKLISLGIIALVVGSVWYLGSSKYYHWHTKPIEQRDVCLQDLSNVESSKLLLELRLDSMEDEIKKTNDETSNLLSNEYSKGYVKGLEDAKQDTSNSGTICFTPIY